MSHRNIFQRIIEENIDLALVLEDDVAFDRGLLEFVQHLDELPGTFDVILLGHHGPASRLLPAKTSIWYQKKIGSKFILGKPGELACGAYAYLVSHKGAKRLAGLMEQIVLPVDHYTGSCRNVNVYTVNPPVVNIYDELSEQSSIDAIGHRNRDELRGGKADNQSIRRRVAESLGVYNMLKAAKSKVNDVIVRLKPIRFYR